MKLQPLDLLGGYGKDDSTAWSPRDCVNYIPELAEDPGARSRLKLRGAPGLKAFATTGTGTRAIRGARNVEGKFFVVSGTSLLQVATDGTTTTLGTIPGTRRCSLSHNQIPGGNELLVVNGNAGYTWNTVTEAFAQVTDEGYPGAIVADYIDTFLAQVEPFGRYWFHSGQAAAGDYNTLDRYESEASPDRIVTGAVNQLEFVAFNETTTEFFVNTGAANAPFTSKRIVIEHGCAGAFAVGRMDNSLLWYGNDGVFYRLNGYQAEPISTGAVEKAVAGMDGANCFTTVYEDEHHKICYWTFPDGITIGYDAVTQLWHRRASYGLDRWRVNTLTKWNGLWIAGDMSNGRLYVLDWDYPLEDREPLVAEFTCPPIHNNQNNAILDWLEFLFDTGSAVVVPAPYAALALSGDLPDGIQGDAVSYEYTVSGGVRPYASVVVSVGTLPAGLSLDTSDLGDGIVRVTGTRTTVGVYPFTLLATDADGNTATLADSSETTSAEIFMWREESGPSAQHTYSAHVSGDIIALGHDNNALSYSLDRGYNWTIIQPLDVVNPVAGLVKYDGDWYAFGQVSGAAKAIGDSFDFAPLAIPFTPTYDYQGAFVIGDYLYAGENSGTTYKMRRFDGTNWTAIDTGVAVAAANSTIASHCQSGDWHLFGTSDGCVIRTNDFATFAKVLDLSVGGGKADVAELNGKVVACGNNGTTCESTDDGATFSAGYAGFRLVSANNLHFIGGDGGGNVSTSTTGATGSWTSRLAPGPRNQTVLHNDADLAVIGTISGLAQIGDVA